MMTEQQQRWKGRHSAKDQLRHRVWSQLEATGAAVGSPWSCIPNFVGAQQAAQELCATPGWSDARVVKSNPDSAQAWVRLAALQQGKRLYMPVPELVHEFPFLLLDPNSLSDRGVPFEDVMYSEGALQHGQRLDFSDIEPLDFVVVGCVAVTRAGGRTGKGAGFADLELGLFRHYGVVSESTPVATTVHDVQLVQDQAVVMQSHDTPLNWIATPGELLATHTRYATPGPLEWDKLQADQYDNIPFLLRLRKELEG